MEAGNREEKQHSEHNDKWALKRVSELRKEMGWDVGGLGRLAIERV